MLVEINGMSASVGAANAKNAATAAATPSVPFVMIVRLRLGMRAPRVGIIRICFTAVWSCSGHNLEVAPYDGAILDPPPVIVDDRHPGGQAGAPG